MRSGQHCRDGSRSPRLCEQPLRSPLPTRIAAVRRPSTCFSKPMLARPYIRVVHSIGASATSIPLTSTIWLRLLSTRRPAKCSLALNLAINSSEKVHSLALWRCHSVSCTTNVGRISQVGLGRVDCRQLLNCQFFNYRLVSNSRFFDLIIENNLVVRAIGDLHSTRTLA